MKKSQIAVLTALGFVLLMMVIVMGLGRIAVGSAMNTADSGIDWDNADEASDSMALDDFDRVVVRGAWSVRIDQGESFSVDIAYPEPMRDRIDVRTSGDTLILGSRDWSGPMGRELSAAIVMPSLREIRIEGAADVDFRGFDEEEMDVAIEGAGQITAEDSRARRLSVSLDGLGQIDLDDLTAVDATVSLDGAGEIILDMDGGILDGNVDGMGSVRYSGRVSDERIDVDGFGSVERE